MIPRLDRWLHGLLPGHKVVRTNYIGWPPMQLMRTHYRCHCGVWWAR